MRTGQMGLKIKDILRIFLFFLTFFPPSTFVKAKAPTNYSVFTIKCILNASLRTIWIAIEESYWIATVA